MASISRLKSAPLLGRWVAGWERVGAIGATRQAPTPTETVVITNQFVLIALSITTAYILFFLLYDFRGTRSLILINAALTLSYLSVLSLNGRGRNLLASVLALSTPCVQLTVVTYLVSFRSGLHVFLLCGGVLSFLLFSNRQQLIRWFFVIVPTILHLIIQFNFTPDRAVVRFPGLVLDGMFIANLFGVSMLLFIASYLFHIQLLRQQDKIARQAEALDILAHTDSLTRLPNRRRLISVLDRESTRPGRDIYTVAIADIDHFKRLNDRYGHGVGDRVLAEIAICFRESLRGNDVVGRWGGEEFIFVLPGTPLRVAEAVLERVRRSVERLTIHCDGVAHRVTVSIGATEVTDEDGYDPAVARADRAMYRGKVEGRNRVVLG